MTLPNDIHKYALISKIYTVVYLEFQDSTVTEELFIVNFKESKLSVCCPPPVASDGWMERRWRVVSPSSVWHLLKLIFCGDAGGGWCLLCLSENTLLITSGCDLGTVLKILVYWEAPAPVIRISSIFPGWLNLWPFIHPWEIKWSNCFSLFYHHRISSKSTSETFFLAGLNMQYVFFFTTYNHE